MDDDDIVTASLSVVVAVNLHVLKLLMLSEFRARHLQNYLVNKAPRGPFHSEVATTWIEQYGKNTFEDQATNDH